MKKFMALILAVAMLFTLVACKKNDPVADAQGDLTGDFVKPENYASVLLVTINPQFRLYLDEDSKVLAVEAVNDDADSIKDEISFEDKSAEDVVKIMITVANEKGFVKAEATVTIEITETVMDDGYKNNVLTELVAAVNEKATELEITVNVSSADSTGSDAQEESESSSSQSSSSASSSKPASSSSSSKSSKSSSSSSSASSSKSSVSSSASSSSASSSSKSSASSSVVSSSASASSKPAPSSAPVVTYKDVKSGVWQLHKKVSVANGAGEELGTLFFTFDLAGAGYGHWADENSIVMGADGAYVSANYKLLSELPEGQRESYRQNGWVIVYGGVEYYNALAMNNVAPLRDSKIENNFVTIAVEYGDITIKMEQISDNQLKVVSMSGSHSLVQVGDIFNRANIFLF